MNLTRQEIDDLEDALFYASVKAAILIFARRITSFRRFSREFWHVLITRMPRAHARRSPAGAFDALDAAFAAIDCYRGRTGNPNSSKEAMKIFYV
jgi:hypothetical protein